MCRPRSPQRSSMRSAAPCHSNSPRAEAWPPPSWRPRRQRELGIRPHRRRALQAPRLNSHLVALCPMDLPARRRRRFGAPIRRIRGTPPLLMVRPSAARATATVPRPRLRSHGRSRTLRGLRPTSLPSRLKMRLGIEVPHLARRRPSSTTTWFRIPMRMSRHIYMRETRTARPIRRTLLHGMARSKGRRRQPMRLLRRQLMRLPRTAHIPLSRIRRQVSRHALRIRPFRPRLALRVPLLSIRI